MHISDFDFELPPERVAREPARPRDASRMMVLGRYDGSIQDATFRQLPDFLEPGDVLVINDTRVMRARIHGRLKRAAGFERNVELLFASPLDAATWEVMCKPGKRIRPGDRFMTFDGALHGVFGAIREHGLRELKLEDPAILETVLERDGHIPLPPYIDRGDLPADASDYQTVFARQTGAVAAPTAGLHFTDTVFETLRARQVDVLRITLHVGVGTFLPVRDDDPRKHDLKSERFEISADVAHRLNEARAAGRRIFAVGTTSTRTLEFVFRQHGRFEPGSGETNLYILPGYEFRVIDGLLTNFHLPRSTLLMLVSAFASRESILRAYAQAVERGYRFYSYGDCMLIR